MSIMSARNSAAFGAASITIKKRATADEIQAELQERIDRLAARDEKFRGCTAPRPRPSQVRTDGTPNWTVDGFPGLPSGGFGRMVELLDQTRMEYELVA
ncbi:MAG: hypothetical protein KIS73_09995 [Enhydrobacter sp.]|nr:hypothetical protein [Enhydrobacter sp.]